MSTQKRKFELFARLQALGFTYEEAVSLRRIEMTLQRWGEAECGDSNDYCSTSIERDEVTGRPYRVTMYHDRKPSEAKRYPVADRELGAIKRLGKIVMARNLREGLKNPVLPYHQGDCRGCNLYLIERDQLKAPENMIVKKAKEYGLHVAKSDALRVHPQDAAVYVSDQFPGVKFDVPEQAARRFLKDKNLSVPDRELLPLDQYYTRGLAVCA